MTRLLIAHGADLNYVSSTGQSVVGATAHEGSHVMDQRYIDCLETLIEAGGRFNLAHLIMLNHTGRLVAELDRDPAQVNEWMVLGHDLDRGYPLHEAADDCNGEMASLLLERGADVHAVDEHGETPLLRALYRGCADEPEREGHDSSSIIGILVDGGTETNLEIAVILGDIERARILLEASPQLAHEPRGDGWTLLDLAVKYDQSEIEKLLRAAGASFAQNVEAMLVEAPPGHSVYKVLAQSSARKTAPGFIDLEPSPSLDIRDEITLAAWVYRVGQEGTVVAKWYQRDSWSYSLNSPGNGFHLHWEDHTQTNVTGFFPYLEWAHYAGTYDGRHMRVDVNGELAAEREVAGKHINSTDNPVWIGAMGYMDRTPGLIDDVQIWNLARTQEEIRQSMGTGLTGDEPGAGRLVSDGRRAAEGPLAAGR